MRLLGKKESEECSTKPAKKAGHALLTCFLEKCPREVLRASLASALRIGKAGEEKAHSKNELILRRSGKGRSNSFDCG
jgi:hypothetical protein